VPEVEPPTFADDLKRSQVLMPGHGIDILRTLPTGDGEMLVLGVLDDGRLFVRAGSALRLESPDGSRTTPITLADPDAAFGVFGYDDDRRHLVWVTTTTDDYFHFPWQMYSLDLRTGVVRTIARHHDVGVDPPPVVPDGTRPRLLHGRVYYAAVRAVTKRGRAVPAIYSVPADGSAPPRLEVDEAYGAMTLGDELVYASSAWGFVNWELHARRPDRPASDRVIASGPGKRRRLSGWASDGATLVWQAKGPDGCALRFLSPELGVTTLGPDRCGPVWSHYHHVADDWVALSTGSGPYRTYLYRLPARKLYRLTGRPTFGFTHGNGDIITWRLGRGPTRGDTIVARVTFDR